MHRCTACTAEGTRRGEPVAMTYNFKCICGVTINADTELQLEKLLNRHSKNSSIHKRQGWDGHSGIGDGTA